jgi:hypothetical protein
MNYSFFLFSQLYTEMVPTGLPYDLRYQVHVAAYNVYKRSTYNDPHRDECACMTAFIREGASPKPTLKSVTHG